MIKDNQLPQELQAIMKRCAGTLVSITQKLMYIRSFLPLVTDVEVSRLSRR